MIRRRSPVVVLAAAWLTAAFGCQSGPSALPPPPYASAAPAASPAPAASGVNGGPNAAPSSAAAGATAAAPQGPGAPPSPYQPPTARPSNGAPSTGAPSNGGPVQAVIRGQSPGPVYGSPGYAPQPSAPQSYTPPTTGALPYDAPPPAVGAAPPAYANYQPPPPVGAAPGDGVAGNGVPGVLPGGIPANGAAAPNWDGIPVPPSMQNPPPNYADLNAMVQETQTGRFQFGVGVNSDAGVTGQIVIDERNFDATRLPNSWDEVINGTALRGAGQGFRIEAMPGNQVHRYLVSFTEPYLFGFSPISLNVSAFYFTRNYFDWNEERLGGRFALGYRLSPDLSVSAALRLEDVEVSDPRVAGVQELDDVVGSNDLYTARFTLTHDTRDIPFFPTEGHYIELAYEQAFGEFDFPRAEIDYRKYMLIRERPDGSGRHTLALSTRVGFSGDTTPLFENYFAGGFSTIRGFSFRGASPIDTGITVGGPFRWLMSAEYFFPLTADDMIKGVFFCDAGTVERDIEVNWDNFRVAPGFGLRLNIPALGPAPLALDFAFPVAKADTDDTQVFSFFFGFGR